MARPPASNANSRPLLTGQARRTRKQLAPDSHHDLRLWLRLLSLSNQIKRRLSARLRQDFGTSMARFDLMAQLDRAAPQGLSMTKLSAQVMVTNGAITGLVNGLVRDGLVQRQSQSGDRRTVIVGLTQLGKRRFLAMARRHQGWVRELFSSVPADLKQEFERCLAGMKQQLQGATRAPDTD